MEHDDLTPEDKAVCKAMGLSIADFRAAKWREIEAEIEAFNVSQHLTKEDSLVCTSLGIDPKDFMNFKVMHHAATPSENVCRTTATDQAARSYGQLYIPLR